MSFPILPHQKLVMIGDSITDADRVRPVAEGLFNPLGNGYVSFVDAILTAFIPQAGIRVVNMGCSGNTVLDLEKRWDTDLLQLKPDWVSIFIGINDVWRQFDLPRQKEIHVLPNVYEKTYDKLISRTKSRVKGIVLLTPYFLEPNRHDAMRARMDEYGAIVKKLGKKHRLRVIDVQAAFDRYLAVRHPVSISWDRVHPDRSGHMMIARAFLDGLGFDWNAK